MKVGIASTFITSLYFVLSELICTALHVCTCMPTLHMHMSNVWNFTPLSREEWIDLLHPHVELLGLKLVTEATRDLENLFLDCLYLLNIPDEKM